jgi:6-phosphofructokinase
VLLLLLLLRGALQVFGRRSGFIAMQSSLSSGVVDVCLIPEEPFELDGPAGVLGYVRKIIEQKGHCVVCVAEGAGQDLLYPRECLSQWKGAHPCSRQYWPGWPG